MIRQIRIHGLRGFATAQTLNVAIPNSEIGSGLTILVGPNNGGKSTVVEALGALSKNRPQSFDVDKRNRGAGDRVTLSVMSSDDQTRQLQTIPVGGSETGYASNVDVGRILTVPSRRFFSPGFGKSGLEREQYIQNYDLPQVRGAAIDHFAGRVFRIQQHRAEFDDVFRRIVEPPPSWTLDQRQGHYFIKFDVGATYHTSDGIGDGLVSLMFLIDALYDSAPGDAVALDEPELSLHPAYQRKLSALLAEYAKDRQIIVATHSPYFIDFSAAFSGGEIARVYRDDNGNSTIASVSRATLNNLKGFLGNISNPHILGLDAREVFFLEDRIVLVEGQEDVLLYPKLLAQLNIKLSGNFFGWGAGGADNIPMIASLLQDLGFSKVVGILDANKQDRIDALQKEFPSFKFFAIPADDIRTKPACAAKDSISGLLDEDLKIREEYLEDVRKIFDDVGVFLG